jgi:hypothetical protein
MSVGHLYDARSNRRRAATSYSDRAIGRQRFATHTSTTKSDAAGSLLTGKRPLNQDCHLYGFLACTHRKRLFKLDEILHALGDGSQMREDRSTPEKERLPDVHPAGQDARFNDSASPEHFKCLAPKKFRSRVSYRSREKLPPVRQADRLSRRPGGRANPGR